MIKIELRNEIKYFEDEVAFGNWLVERRQVRSLATFTNDEYSAWDMLVGRYNLEEVKEHWWETEVMDEVREWFTCGLAEEIV